MSEFVKVATLSDFDPPDEGVFIEVEGTQIALFKIEDRIYAVEEKCPHRGAPLSEGQLIGKELRCPWHGARFDLETGKALCPPAQRAIKCYPVQVVGDEVRIQLEP